MNIFYMAFKSVDVVIIFNSVCSSMLEGESCFFSFFFFLFLREGGGLSISNCLLRLGLCFVSQCKQVLDLCWSSLFGNTFGECVSGVTFCRCTKVRANFPA